MPKMPRTVRLNFRLSDEGKRHIQKQAQQAGLTASAYVRRELLGAARQAEASAGPLDQVLDQLRQTGEQVAAMAAMARRTGRPQETEELRRVLGRLSRVMDRFRSAVHE